VRAELEPHHGSAPALWQGAMARAGRGACSAPCSSPSRSRSRSRSRRWWWRWQRTPWSPSGEALQALGRLGEGGGGTLAQLSRGGAAVARAGRRARGPGSRPGRSCWTPPGAARRARRPRPGAAAVGDLGGRSRRHRQSAGPGPGTPVPNLGSAWWRLCASGSSRATASPRSR
jgi:hypothetical protein